ncbi:EamA family transporter [Pseudobacteriovorax antillogorgiicola]|uniref:Transporter family protein n=1 Tax=Pseudobacteriovorax antillogorgiicola TaxID=1513793 RepID=A0A1Y6CI91_9BACT|nr:EamA family transporter [Pseudobacteriovorax antillogorgiicola]TCS46939.1 transporter family protein [Pseudobacteriovorax antillogorgiicola]SMF64387.1 transporter family protein [Pseudobacteriovorax antillogorgiicola]
MTWMTWALLSTLLYGLWAFLGKLSSSSLSDKQVFILQFLGSLPVIAYVVVSGGNRIPWDSKDSYLALLFGSCGMLATFFFVKALQKGSASTVTLMTALYPAVTVVLAAIFLKESLNGRQISGIVLGILGIYLLVSSS